MRHKGVFDCFFFFHSIWSRTMGSYMPDAASRVIWKDAHHFRIPPPYVACVVRLFRLSKFSRKNRRPRKRPSPLGFFLSGGQKKRSSLIPLPVTIPLLSHHYEKRSARMRKRRRWQRRCRNARLFFPVQDELHFSDANWRVAAVPPLSNDARCECRARHCSAKIAPPGGITKFTIRTPTAKNPAVSCPPFCRMCGMETCADNPCPGGLLPPGAGDCWVEGVSEEKLHSGSCVFAASSNTWLVVFLFSVWARSHDQKKKKKGEKARLLSSQPCLKAPVHLAPDETRQPTVIKHGVIYQQGGPSWWKHGYGRSRHEEVDLMWGSACFVFFCFICILKGTHIDHFPVLRNACLSSNLFFYLNFSRIWALLGRAWLRLASPRLGGCWKGCVANSRHPSLFFSLPFPPLLLM